MFAIIALLVINVILYHFVLRPIVGWVFDLVMGIMRFFFTVGFIVTAAFIIHTAFTLFF